ncbi:MAG: hypothetical protein MjAS7_0064 [Metallosphaera javensis (ex Sakai et al. 2022)]|nr:MAG: hypothetical protein MjAS7_0064 [Metallosphaera javensis (ex Sakai et al. 2022)]
MCVTDSLNAGYGRDGGVKIVISFVPYGGSQLVSAENGPTIPILSLKTLLT